MDKNIKKNTHTCITESFCCAWETNTTTSTVFQLKKMFQEKILKKKKKEKKRENILAFNVLLLINIY